MRREVDLDADDQMGEGKDRDSAVSIPLPFGLVWSGHTDCVNQPG